MVDFRRTVPQSDRYASGSRVVSIIVVDPDLRAGYSRLRRMGVGHDETVIGVSCDGVSVCILAVGAVDNCRHNFLDVVRYVFVAASLGQMVPCIGPVARGIRFGIIIKSYRIALGCPAGLAFSLAVELHLHGRRTDAVGVIYVVPFLLHGDGNGVGICKRDSIGGTAAYLFVCGSSGKYAAGERDGDGYLVYSAVVLDAVIVYLAASDFPYPVCMRGADVGVGIGERAEREVSARVVRHDRLGAALGRILDLADLERELASLGRGAVVGLRARYGELGRHGDLVAYVYRIGGVRRLDSAGHGAGCGI